jgi:UDP-N-acetyl-D-galactosamine dehydrogenase
LTFKENVADIRNTKVIDVIRELESFNVDIDIVDPHASPEEVKAEYDLELKAAPEEGAYHAVIAAVNHEEYAGYGAEDFRGLLREGRGTVVDVKGVFRGRTGDLDYWSL